jgi:hypothetical protein
MKPRIFLDIDGVLNGHEHCHFERPGFARIKPACAAILQEIIDRTQAEITLISSWGHIVREGEMTAKGFKFLLKTHGVYATLADAIETASEPAARSRLVNAYLATLAQGQRFCVLDDLPLTVRNLIRPIPSIGLEPYHIPSAVRLLGAATA